MGGTTDRPESHATEKSDEDKGGSHAGGGGFKGKGKKGKDGKKLEGKGSKECESLSGEEIVRDPVKEAEIMLMQRFRTYEHAQKDIADLLEVWDRSSLQIRRPPTPSERSE